MTKRDGKSPGPQQAPADPLAPLVDAIAERVAERQRQSVFPGEKSSTDVPLEPLAMYTTDQLLAIVNADSKRIRRWIKECGLKGYRMDLRLKYLGADVLRCLYKDGELADPAALLVGNPVIPVEMIQHLLQSMIQQVAKIVEAKIRHTDGPVSGAAKGARSAETGVILPDAAYTVESFCKLLGIGRQKLSDMRRNGLKIRVEGRVSVVLGADFIKWANGLPTERGTFPE